MKNYKCLFKNRFELDSYSIVPIRDEDMFLIMKWRNEQIYHLRQNKKLTKRSQIEYFTNVIHELFDNPYPTQILFSYLEENNICVGYGGLVKINWIDKNAEISFIINTELELDFFEFHWSNYLNLIQEVAFNYLKLHKIYTFAFDLRPQLYNILLKNGFYEEAVLKEHCFFEHKFIDVRIHTKINSYA